MENSIKEDIKNAEHFIKSIKTDKEYKEENGWHGYYNKEIVELARILQHILSDYKRVLKENEELKESNKIYALNGSNINLEIYIKDKYIPKQIIKDKIEELKQEKKKYGNCLIEMYEDELVNRDIKILQELLEGRK